MNCRAAEHEMQRALDTPLTPAERARLDAHLNACPACRRAWEEGRRLSREATTWVNRPSPAETPTAQFTAQVMARLELRSAPLPLWPRLLLAVGVAVLLAVLSPWVSPWLPPVPHWEMPWTSMADLGMALGVPASRWAAVVLLPALALNTLFVLRARRTA